MASGILSVADPAVSLTRLSLNFVFLTKISFQVAEVDRMPASFEPWIMT